MVFLHFLWEGLDIGFWHMHVGVKWDPRRTAAKVPSNFMVFNPIFCYVSPKIMIFQEPLITETCNICSIGFSMPWTLNMHHSSNFNVFFPVKINKMWNFCLKLWFFRNHLSQRLEICSIGFSMPQTLNMEHSSHFDAFFPVKSNKMWNFGCFLNSPWQKTEKMSIYTGKKHLQGLANLHI